MAQIMQIMAAWTLSSRAKQRGHDHSRGRHDEVTSCTCKNMTVGMCHIVTSKRVDANCVIVVTTDTAKGLWQSFELHAMQSVH